MSTASKRSVSPRIRAHALDVVPAINLNGEPPPLRQKINDERTKQRHLPPKHHAEPSAANSRPK